MSDILTLTVLNAMLQSVQDKLLRQKVTEALGSGPWKHDPGSHGCRRCLLQYEDTFKRGSPVCPVPPEAVGTWAEIEIQLRDKLMQDEWGGGKLLGVLLAYPGRDLNELTAWHWYSVKATARERVIILLIALGKITV